MAEVENDTDDTMDYLVEEGEGRSGFRIFEKLKPRETKDLPLARGGTYRISFYKGGKHDDSVVFEDGVTVDSYITLRCLEPDHWKVKVRSRVA